MGLKMLYSNCSEMVYKLELGEWLFDKDKQKLMDTMFDMFEPWSDDKNECDEFIFLDEENNCIVFRDRSDGSEEGDFEYIHPLLKKYKLELKTIGDKPDRPLFSVGENLYYQIGDNVKVVNLNYSNLTKANKAHKRLLKIWRLNK